MFRYILRRLAVMIPILVVTSFLVYLLVSLTPGDQARAIAGPEATAENLAQVRIEHHLDRSVVVQYWYWLKDAVQLKFGDSYATHSSVVTGLGERIPATFGLVILAIVFAVLLAVPMGAFSALRPKGGLDNGLSLFMGVELAIPNFVLAILLVIIFGLQLQVLPLSGYVPFSSDPAGWFQHMVLPAATLAAFLSAVVGRQLRAAMIDVLSNNYVRAAWARGDSRLRVISKHVLRNASLPAITVLSIQAATMLGSTVLVEQIFSVPGIGSYLLGAVLGRDVPIIQACILMFVVAQVLVALVTDIVYGMLNPRLRVN